MIDLRDRQLLAEVQLGLPLCSRPYHQIGVNIDMPEAEVIERLTRLKQHGLIKRMGVIVKHRLLGYHANAMVVWNIPDEKVKQLGGRISQFSFVTLCYQRPRQPEWPYNLFAMVHGKSRDDVDQQIQRIADILGDYNQGSDVLYSTKILKKTGFRSQQGGNPMTTSFVPTPENNS